MKKPCRINKDRNFEAKPCAQPRVRVNWPVFKLLTASDILKLIRLNYVSVDLEIARHVGATFDHPEARTRYRIGCPICLVPVD